MNTPPSYLTAAETAERLRLNEWAVRQLCAKGKLRAYKPGKSWLIDPADLDAYIKSNGERGAA